MNSNVKARVEDCGRCDSCKNKREGKKTEEKKINDTTKKTEGVKKPSTTDLTGCVYIPTKEDVKE